MGERYTHWSGHCSLYSGKTRSYLIKKGLDFDEASPGHARYTEVLRPMIGYFSIPVLETPEGDVVQDSTAIIKHLEDRHPEPAMQPDDPVMRALAWLIHCYGTEGLFKPAHHYRWSFLDENLDYLIDEIGRGLTPIELSGGPEGRARGEAFAAMKVAALPRISVTPETIPAIERSTELLFDRLDRHFRQHPYILGGRPSVADCGLMTALHAHLGRDPYPVRLMKRRAPALYRWTETMNRPGFVDAEHCEAAPVYFEADALPETLLDVLRLLSADFGPELSATAQAYEDWLAVAPERPAGALVSIIPDPALRQSLGMVEYVQQGATIAREAWPDILLMHQDVLAILDGMNPALRKRFEDLMRAVGGEVFLRVRPTRRLTRAKFTIVLG